MLPRAKGIDFSEALTLWEHGLVSPSMFLGKPVQRVRLCSLASQDGVCICRVPSKGPSTERGLLALWTSRHPRLTYRGCSASRGQAPSLLPSPTVFPAQQQMVFHKHGREMNTQTGPS